MGDRIGIIFNTAMGMSDLYAHSHWGGRDLLVAAQEFIRERRPAADDSPDGLVREFVKWLTDRTWSPDSVDVRSYAEDGDYEDCEDNGVFIVDREAYVYRPRDPIPGKPFPLYRGTIVYRGAVAPSPLPSPPRVLFRQSMVKYIYLR